MEHSEKFELVKTYYDNYVAGIKPCWNKKRVHDAVGKWITADEYEEITGEPYEVTA